MNQRQLIAPVSEMSSPYLFCYVIRNMYMFHKSCFTMLLVTGS